MVRTVCKPLGHRSTCHRGTRSVSRSTGLQNAHYTKPSCYALDNIFEPIVLDECHVFQVSPLSKESITQASVVITRAFAVSPQYIPIDECRNYCSRLLKHDESEGIMLVGSMSPGPDCPEVGPARRHSEKSGNRCWAIQLEGCWVQEEGR